MLAEDLIKTKSVTFYLARWKPSEVIWQMFEMKQNFYFVTIKTHNYVNQSKLIQFTLNGQP